MREYLPQNAFNMDPYQSFFIFYPCFTFIVKE